MTRPARTCQNSRFGPAQPNSHLCSLPQELSSLPAPPLCSQPNPRFACGLTFSGARAAAAAAASTNGRVKGGSRRRREGERMVKGRPKPTPANAPAEVVFDPSAPGARKPRRSGAPSSSSTGEWHNFMGSSLSDMYRKPAAEKSGDTSDDDEEPDIDIGKLLKDVELFGASTWKERKQLENHKVVQLGGKAIKKHRMPLSVSKPAMKNQKKREEKKAEEERLLGIFRKRDSKNSKAQKTRPEDRVLRATQGHFKNGILDVKHLLAPPKPSGRDAPEQKMRMGKKKGKGKQKGGRRKRR
uniref:Uncharacterized protein n=1 Tax=Oryza punctata TaxID=4537 RepID=A0A0E0JFT2_ORYPU